AVGLGTADDEKRGGGDEGEQARHDVEPRGEPVAGQRREQRGGDRRDDENGLDGSERGHGRSPRLSSSSLTSTESKRSRMRKRKTPITISATSTEKATEISTTSGMPLAPVAARMRPFSIDMKPTIWLTALRRVTIMRSPSSTTQS